MVYLISVERMRVGFFVVACIFWTAAAVNLSPEIVCSEYTQCRRDLTTHEEFCENLQVEEGKPLRRIEFVPIKNDRVMEDISVCGVELHEEYVQLRQHLEKNKEEVIECIGDDIIRFERYNHMISLDKKRFCTSAMRMRINESSTTSEDCWMNAKKRQRKCARLRSCCQPATTCELAAADTVSGKAIASLKEEIGIRLADCRSMKGGERRGKKVTEQKPKKEHKMNERRKFTLENSIKRTSKEHLVNSREDIHLHNKEAQKISIKIVPHQNPQLPKDPEPLCAPYLECLDDLFDFRQQCNAVIGLPINGPSYSWSLYYMQSEPIDEADRACRRESKADYERILQLRQVTREFLSTCVVHANVTKEQTVFVRPCAPHVFFSIPPSTSSVPSASCRADLHAMKERCTQLRDCCPHADVCERSAVHNTLVDDYMNSMMNLRTRMNECYHRRSSWKKL